MRIFREVIAVIVNLDITETTVKQVIKIIFIGSLNLFLVDNYFSTYIHPLAPFFIALLVMQFKFIKKRKLFGQ